MNVHERYGRNYYHYIVQCFFYVSSCLIFIFLCFVSPCPFFIIFSNPSPYHLVSWAPSFNVSLYIIMVYLSHKSNINPPTINLLQLHLWSEKNMALICHQCWSWKTAWWTRKTHKDLLLLAANAWLLYWLLLIWCASLLVANQWVISYAFDICIHIWSFFGLNKWEFDGNSSDVHTATDIFQDDCMSCLDNPWK